MTRRHAIRYQPWDMRGVHADAALGSWGYAATCLRSKNMTATTAARLIVFSRIILALDRPKPLADAGL